VQDRAHFGGTHRGHFAGWTFNSAAFDEWSTSPDFQYLSACLGDAGDEGSRRAVAGLLVFDRAALQHRPDLKMIGLTSALEAWLLQRGAGSQTKRLARLTSWFGCGAYNGELCGRSRPICPYLHLSPDRQQDRKRLDTLRKLGNEHTAWRCSEWHRVMDWYQARSDAAHGQFNVVDTKHAEEAEYWISHYLLEPILLWLRDHPDDPVGDLEKLLNSIEDPANWGSMTAALDATPPPQAPPWEAT
jgi:hypothetical protein